MGMVVQSHLEIASIVCYTAISSRNVTMVANAIPIVLHNERLVADVADIRVIPLGLRFALGPLFCRETESSISCRQLLCVSPCSGQHHRWHLYRCPRLNVYHR